MGIPFPDPLVVECDTCGKRGETYDFQHPDLAVECGCCPVAHDHAGLGCRPVTITATARLLLFNAIVEMLDAAHELPQPVLEGANS